MSWGHYSSNFRGESPNVRREIPGIRIDTPRVSTFRIGDQDFRPYCFGESMITLKPPTSVERVLSTRIFYSYIVEDVKFNEKEGFLFYMKGTKGINDMNFKQKVMEKDFEKIIKKIPKDKNAIFFDEYGQIMKVINNEP